MDVFLRLGFPNPPRLAEKEPRCLVASEAKDGTIMARLRVHETASIESVTAT
jgi:hypothetical protein